MDGRNGAYGQKLGFLSVEQKMHYKVGDEISAIRTGNSFLVEGIHEGGAMGIVYRARRRKDKKLYALKAIRFEKAKDEKKREGLTNLFRWESQVWIILGKHRNIVQAHWFDYSQHYQPLLIMEYVEGGDRDGITLRDYLKKHEKSDLPKTLEFIIEALTGLIYAGDIVKKELRMPFIHRDLKPENLFITESGLIKVSDFGLVKAYGILQGRGGTPNYMPPEQWEQKEIAEKTDIYALGCIIHEMLASRVLFWGRNLAELEKKHYKEKPKPLEGQPEAVNRIIQKCLEKEPDKRYDSFKEVREKLQDVYKDLSGDYLVVKDTPEPFTDEDLNSRGSGFDQLGFHEKAKECYDKAIERNPQDARYFINRGNAYFYLSRYDEAISDYKEAIRLNPNMPEVYINSGNLYAKMRQYEYAIVNYDKATALNGSIPEVYICRGNALSMLNRYEDAVEDYKKAIGLNPEYAEAYANLGNAYLCMGKHEDAESCYLKAIALNPEYKEKLMKLNRFIQK